MKEIIEQILKEEELAGQKIGGAKDQAQALVDKAKAQAQVFFDESLAKAKEEILNKKEKFQNDSLIERGKILESARAENVSIREHKESHIAIAAARTFLKVIKIS
jgi:vacuolar-type H+-ATPase subunit H